MSFIPDAVTNLGWPIIAGIIISILAVAFVAYRWFSSASSSPTSVTDGPQVHMDAQPSEHQPPTEDEETHLAPHGDADIMTSTQPPM